MALKYVHAKKWGKLCIVQHRSKEVMGEWAPCAALPGHRSPREKVSFGFRVSQTVLICILRAGSAVVSADIAKLSSA